MRFSDKSSIVLALPLALWLLIPSTVFLQPKSVNYIGRDATFVREVPFGGVHAHWITEVYVLSSDKECSVDGVSFYQYKENSTVKYKVHENLWPCMDAFGEKVIYHSWSVRLLNMIPLRSHTFAVAKLDN